MAFAYISRRGSDLWKLSFYELERGRLRFASSVTCCWASALIILEIRRRNEQAEQLAGAIRRERSRDPTEAWRKPP